MESGRAQFIIPNGNGRRRHSRMQWRSISFQQSPLKRAAIGRREGQPALRPQRPENVAGRCRGRAGRQAGRHQAGTRQWVEDCTGDNCDKSPSEATTERGDSSGNRGRDREVATEMDGG